MLKLLTFRIISLINNRNFLLLFSIFLGLLLGDSISFLTKFSSYILAIVMIFATISFKIKTLLFWKSNFNVLVLSFILNYLILGGSMLIISFWYIPNNELLLGFVVLAASPPGPSVVPFSVMLKGNTNTSIVGLLGLSFISIFFAPLAIFLFTKNEEFSLLLIFLLLLKIILLPLLISTFVNQNLRIHKQLIKIKSRVINWGFFLIILAIVAQSKEILFSNPKLIVQSSVPLLISMFIFGLLFYFISIKFLKNYSKIISYTFLITTKSSAFAAVIIFNTDNIIASIPIALHAFFVTLFFIVFSNIASKNQDNF